MKNTLWQDVPPRAAALVVLLALVAGVVTGGEKPQQVAEPATRPASPSVSPAPPDLDLSKLERPAPREGIQDLFAPPTPAAPPPAPVAAAAPSPSKAEPLPPPAPPPLPYRFVGRMGDGDRHVVFLAKGESTLNATVGATLDSQYQVERITATELHLVYLPLGAKQVLSLPVPTQGATR